MLHRLQLLEDEACGRIGQRRLEQRISLKAFACEMPTAELDADGARQLAQGRHHRLVLDLDTGLGLAVD